MRTRRAEWAERVARWRRSGVTAKRFAASIGVKPDTLRHWAWRLGRARPAPAAAKPSARRATFVEVMTAGMSEARVELELSDGRRLHIPSGFDPAALARLLGVLERR